MKDTVSVYPMVFDKLLEETTNIGFDQLSDPMLGSLLSTLSATKPGGKFLELGTGSGISTAWILQGMDSSSSLTTIDNDKKLVTLAKQHLGEDRRVKFIVGESEHLILDAEPNSIDFIFADAWAGKYSYVNETLALLKDGGIYLVDDMMPRASWPEGHSDKADHLIQYLESREDCLMTKISWSSGIIVCVKKA